MIRICIRIRDPDCHQNLIVFSFGPLPTSLKISCKSVRKFFRLAQSCYQTVRQTDNGDYITSLAEVISPCIPLVEQCGFRWHLTRRLIDIDDADATSVEFCGVGSVNWIRNDSRLLLTENLETDIYLKTWYLSEDSFVRSTQTPIHTVYATEPSSLVTSAVWTESATVGVSFQFCSQWGWKRRQYRYV